MKIYKPLNIAVFTKKEDGKFRVQKLRAGHCHAASRNALPAKPEKAFELALLSINKTNHNNMLSESMKNDYNAEVYAVAMEAMALSPDGALFKNIFSDAVKTAKAANYALDAIYKYRCKFLENEINRTVSSTEKLRLVNEGVSVASEWLSSVRGITEIRRKEAPVTVLYSFYVSKLHFESALAKELEIGARKADISNLLQLENAAHEAERFDLAFNSRQLANYYLKAVPPDVI